jgi:hypothetical protein
MMTQQKMRETINRNNVDYLNTIIWYNTPLLTLEKHLLA